MHWSNKKEVLIEVNSNGRKLRHAAKELKNDKEIVMCAVRKNGDLLKYASNGLQNDKDLLVLLEKDNKRAITFHQQWYQERMNVLSSYRESKILENSMENHFESKKRVYKF